MTTVLYAKLAAITEEVGVVQKGGFNDFHKYNYVEERDVLEMVRAKLAMKRVVLLPSVTAISERDVTSAKGKHSTITTLHVRFTFIDGESGETHECDWVGQGDDAGDKGANKAATSALKYFLLKAFLIPTGEPDPEGDPKTDDRAAEREAPAYGTNLGTQVAPDSGSRVSPEAADELYKAIKAAGLTWEQVHERASIIVGEKLPALSDENAVHTLKTLTEKQAELLGARVARFTENRQKVEA